MFFLTKIHTECLLFLSFVCFLEQKSDIKDHVTSECVLTLSSAFSDAAVTVPPAATPPPAAEETPCDFV